jgi:hypothetical protein
MSTKEEDIKLLAQLQVHLGNAWEHLKAAKADLDLVYIGSQSNIPDHRRVISPAGQARQLLGTAVDQIREALAWSLVLQVQIDQETEKEA